MLVVAGQPDRRGRRIIKTNPTRHFLEDESEGEQVDAVLMGPKRS